MLPQWSSISVPSLALTHQDFIIQCATAELWTSAVAISLLVVQRGGGAFSQSLFLLLPVNRKTCNASLCNVVMLSKLPQMSSRWDMKRRRNCNPVCQVSLTLFPLQINSDLLIGLLIKRQSSVVGGLAEGACETDAACSPSVTLQRQKQSCHPAHSLMG